MKLYNTLTRKFEKLQPLKQTVVTFYSCGPTVYDYLQIGNWLSFIRWDMLVRTLRVLGYEVRWIMNITDVGHLVSDADEGEDKLEKGARREGKSAWEVADFYTQDFLKGLDALNLSIPRDHLPRATDHIHDQINLIRRLEDKGFTYAIGDGVYFDTSKFPQYGALARLDAEKLKPGARVALNPEKRNAGDFALWKFSTKEHKRDMEWDSPWGKGFPGWHIECSAMAMKYLGATIDIHAGGVDHIPVHHTNEIAQSEAATGKPFANLWLHSNFLTVGDAKLSKSLGNSFTLQDIERRGFGPLDFRLFGLQSHYRTQANFTWKNLAAARNRLFQFRAMADMRWQAAAAGKVTAGTLDKAKSNLLKALNADLNTPKALAELSKLETALSTKGLHVSGQKDFMKFTNWLDQLFGLQLVRSDITKTQKQLLDARQRARETQNWPDADRLRDELKAQGIAVTDTSYGQRWQRI